MTTKTRNSAFELLRIIAMAFIVIGHISLHAQKGKLDSHNYIIALCTTGVNLFILISGYFGIKLSWKSLLKFVSTIVFYNIITTILKWGITRTPPDIDSIKILLEPFKESSWWFINCYFNLMLLSPIINVALNKCTERQLKYFLGVLLFISCISGFCFRNSINPNGYNTFQFVTMYVLGNAIHRFDLPTRFSTRKLLIVYILCTYAIYICSFIIMYRSTFYNNPLIIVSAVCLFCLISKIDIRSSLVNRTASYMLPIYLLQDSPLGFKIYNILYSKGCELNFTGWEYANILVIYIVVLLTSTFILETTRQLLLNKLINNASNSLKEKVNIFDE